MEEIPKATVVKIEPEDECFMNKKQCIRPDQSSALDYSLYSFREVKIEPPDNADVQLGDEEDDASKLASLSDDEESSSSSFEAALVKFECNDEHEASSGSTNGRTIQESGVRVECSVSPMDCQSTSKRARKQDSTDESEDSDDSDSIMYDNDILSELDSESDCEQNATSAASDWSYWKEQATQIPFFATPGVKVPMNGSDPIDYFNLIADDNFYNLIISGSNEYAVKILSKSYGSKSRITRWKELSVAEFKTWLGLLFHMGTIQMQRLSDYWKKNYLFNMSIFSQFMSRDRFILILKALRFNSNNKDKTSLGKIKPLVDLFNERMNTIYEPKQNLSIGKPLVLRCGRLIFWQNMKGRKSGHGIKVYMLVECGGLALKLFIYGGSADKEKNHIQKVIRKLIEGKTGMGHSLFMDSHYSSVQVVEDLLKQKTFVTGTLKNNRKGNPYEVVKKKLKPGESVSQYKKAGICVTKWKDRQEVLAISSQFDGDIKEATNIQGKLCKRPSMVAEYNKNMGSANLFNQLFKYYPCQQKSLRSYKKLGKHIFQLILLNSYYLYLSQNQRMSLYDFRLEVIKSLLSPPPPALPQQPNTRIHLLSYCDRNSSGITKRRRCKYCWQTAMQRKCSSYCCRDCPDIPGFCLEPCFRLFHNY